MGSSSPTRMGIEKKVIMGKVELYQSLLGIYLFMAVGVFCVAIGCVMIASGGPVGWCLMPIGILGILTSILTLKRSRLRIIMTSTGITAKTRGPGEILWQDIDSARIEHYSGGSIVILELVSGKTERIYVSGLQVSGGEVLHLIRERLSRTTA